MSVPDYSTKVPEGVQAANTEKLGQSEGELIRLADALAALSTMDR